MKTQTIYIEVPVSERDKTAAIICSNSTDTIYLEKKEDQIVMDVESFKKAIGDAFDEGWNASWASEKYTEDKEQYLTNLIK